jgi:hypothetical protein
MRLQLWFLGKILMRYRLRLTNTAKYRVVMILLFLVIKNACFKNYVSGLADFQDGSGLAIADWQI